MKGAVFTGNRGVEEGGLVVLTGLVDPAGGAGVGGAHVDDEGVRGEVVEQAFFVADGGADRRAVPEAEDDDRAGVWISEERRRGDGLGAGFDEFGDGLWRAVVDGEVTTISIDAVGNRNEQNIATSLPQFRANVFLDWVTDRNNVRVVMRHIDEYNDDKTVDQTFNETIDAFTTFDAFYTYTFRNDATSLHFNVINIADEEPPFADQDLNFDARIHSPFGRQYQVVFRHSFGN